MSLWENKLAVYDREQRKRDREWHSRHILVGASDDDFERFLRNHENWRKNRPIFPNDQVIRKIDYYISAFWNAIDKNKPNRAKQLSNTLYKIHKGICSIPPYQQEYRLIYEDIYSVMMEKAKENGWIGSSKRLVAVL